MAADPNYEPINRDRGKAWVAYTGRPDHAVVRDKFHDRFGFYPNEVLEDGPYTLVGPTPDQIDDVDLYDWEDDDDQQ